MTRTQLKALSNEALATLAQNGNELAMDVLLRRYEQPASAEHAFLVRIANKINTDVLDKDTLLSIGLKGVYSAAMKYSLAAGSSFASYAYICVRNMMLEEVEEYRGKIDLVEGNADEEENATPRAFFVEMDDEYMDYNEYGMYDGVDAMSADSALRYAELCDVLEAFLMTLSSKEAYILRHHNDFFGSEFMSCVELAAELHLQEKTVQNTYSIVLGKLRKYLNEGYLNSAA